MTEDAEVWRDYYAGWSEIRRTEPEGSDRHRQAVAACAFLIDEAELYGIDLADDVTAERKAQAAARLMAAAATCHPSDPNTWPMAEREQAERDGLIRIIRFDQ